jgi:hypothetical protein
LHYFWALGLAAADLFVEGLSLYTQQENFPSVV